MNATNPIAQTHGTKKRKGKTGKVSSITTKEILEQIKDIENALCELSKEESNGENMEESN